MKKRHYLFLLLGIVAILSSIWLYTLLVSPSKQTLDQRVHDVASQLKCLVCQGESVADSPATLSLQMRGVIRQQLHANKGPDDADRAESMHIDEKELAYYQREIEQELAAEDPIFSQLGSEVE